MGSPAVEHFGVQDTVSPFSRRGLRNGRHLALLVFACFFTSCGKPPFGLSGTTSVVVQANVLGSTAGLVVDVSGPGISPSVLFNIPVGIDSTAIDTIAVSAGGGRRFVITAIDTSGIATHRGDTTINLVEGRLEQLSMVLRVINANLRLRISLAGS